MGISSQLLPIVIKVTSIHELIMRIRLKHTVGFKSFVAVCTPTEMHETEVKMFYANLISVFDQGSFRETLVILGDFNVTIGTDWIGYELCAGPHGSETRNINNSLLDSRRSRILSSW